MIYVDRSRVPRPKILESIAPRELQKATDFFSGDEKSRRQRRFDFVVFKHPDVREALGELFYD